jgi:hypothetical protein
MLGVAELSSFSKDMIFVHPKSCFGHDKMSRQFSYYRDSAEAFITNKRVHMCNLKGTCLQRKLVFFVSAFDSSSPDLLRKCLETYKQAKEALPQALQIAIMLNKAYCKLPEKVAMLRELGSRLIAVISWSPMFPLRYPEISHASFVAFGTSNDFFNLGEKLGIKDYRYVGDCLFVITKMLSLLQVRPRILW